MSFSPKAAVLTLSFFTCGMMEPCLFFFSSSYAKDQTVTTLDPVVVTGSSHPTTLHQPTQSITLVQEENFSTLQPNRLVNILQQVPGLHLDEGAGRGGISSLYLRGADPNFTLIMLDGIPLNDATDNRGGAVDLSTIPLAHISRVEIVRGPLSALYGSEAMAGAINLITHPPTADSFVRLLGEAGKFESLKGGIQAGGKLGSVTSSVSFFHEQNDEQVEKDEFSQTSIGWNFHVASTSVWDIELTGQYADSLVHSFPEGSGGPDLALLRETEKRDTQQFLIGLTTSLHHPFDWEHRWFISYSRRHQEVVTPGILATPTIFALPPADFETTYDRLQLRQTQTWTILPEWIMTLGGQFTYEKGKRNGYQDLSAFGGSSTTPVDFSLNRNFGGIFSEVTWTGWPGLIFNSGVRWNISEDFEPNVSPRAQASYQILPFLQVRGGYGEGFKLPGLASLGDPQIGNSNLTPEFSKGWDLSLQLETLDKNHQVTLTYFHNRFRDLIDLDPQLLNQGIFQLTNLDHVTTKGIEASILSSPFSDLSIQLSLTYLKTRISETGDRLRNRPKWRGSMGMTYQIGTSLTIQGQITSISSRRDFQVPTQSTQVDGYTKADMTLWYFPFPEWKVYTTLENITNASYEDFKGFSAPPVIFRIGLEYSPNFS